MTGISAFGTLLKMGDGAMPEVFATIAEITDLSGPGFSLDTIEATSHSSPGAFKEYVVGPLDGTEVSFTINFIPTDPTHGTGTGGLLSAMLARAKKNFRIVFPDTAATTWEVSGLITGFDMAEPTDDMLSADVTIKVTGEPNFAVVP